MPLPDSDIAMAHISATQGIHSSLHTRPGSSLLLKTGKPRGCFLLTLDRTQFFLEASRSRAQDTLRLGLVIPSSTSPQYARAKSWNQRQYGSDKQPSTPASLAQGQLPDDGEEEREQHPPLSVSTSCKSGGSFRGTGLAPGGSPFLWASMA